MSELSRLFVKQKYSIEREMSIGPDETRIWMKKDEMAFIIDFSIGEYLILSVCGKPDEKEALVAAGKICTQFMGAEPICHYEIKPTTTWLHCMEWNLPIPEKRLSVIVNRDSGTTTFRNLVLLGGYCISDFEDATLRQAYLDAETLRQKYPGVYGKDPGDCDVVRVAQASEFGLFLEYTMLLSIYVDQIAYQEATSFAENVISFAMHGLSAVQIQVHQSLLALDYVIAAICRKTGIAILDEPSPIHRLRVDGEEFLKWYNFYANHLEKICPDDDSLEEVLEAYQLEEDISMYAPHGDWRSN